MNAAVTGRHGDAVHTIVNAIKKGPLGGCMLFSHAEKWTRYPDRPDRGGRKLPRWVLPYGEQTSKPDIVLCQDLDHDASVRHLQLLQTNREKRALHTLILLELKYTSDVSVHEKEDDNDVQAQHQTLVINLRAAGWPVLLHTMVLGVMGMCRTKDAIFLQEHLGIADPSKLFRSLHRQSIKSTSAILATYNRLVDGTYQRQDQRPAHAPAVPTDTANDTSNPRPTVSRPVTRASSRLATGQLHRPRLQGLRQAPARRLFDPG